MHGRPPIYVIQFCWRQLKVQLDANFLVDEIDEHFDFILKRYTVFTWMLCKHGLRHCVLSNVLTAPVAVWDDIIESEPFSVTYQHSGDSRWGVLCYFFGDVYASTPSPPLDRNSTNDGYELEQPN
ncbi:NIMA-related kinase 2 [Striga asiatica]|uniref:NIMA-related kinase 2 n=1 Tax=Striga asiatica TaxID=4170 RepID=A0A5A7RDU9_STRAF|nr:NIMA-related kinase 2 [Striga asiatica]